MIVPQFVELDIFLEALERGVAGELLEARDVDAGGDAARDRPAPRLWPANAAASSPARPVQFLTISAIESVSIGLVPIR